MQNSETKLLIGLAICAGVGISVFPITMYFSDKKKHEAEIKRAEIEGQYPPEYWKAKEAEAKADAEVKKAKIESQERLEIDRRERQEAEVARKREYEMNAPTEYWEQKKVEEQEKTKRELNRQRYNAEMEAAKQHKEAIESGIRATERAIKSNFGNL